MANKKYVKLFEEFQDEIEKVGDVIASTNTLVEIDFEEDPAPILTTYSISIFKSIEDKENDELFQYLGMEEDLGEYFKEYYQEPVDHYFNMSDNQYLLMYIHLTNDNEIESNIRLLDDLHFANTIKNKNTKQLCLYVFSKKEYEELLNKRKSQFSISYTGYTTYDSDEVEYQINDHSKAYVGPTSLKICFGF